MVVISTGSSLYRCPCLPGIGRFVNRSVGDINNIWVFRVDDDLTKIPAAAPQTLLIRYQLPACPGIVRAIQPANFCVYYGVQSFRICPRDRYPDTPLSFRRDSNFQRLPRITAVGRFKNAAARAIRGRVDTPWRSACIPKGGVDDL